MRFAAKIENKSLKYFEIDRMKKYLSTLKDGQMLSIEIDKQKKNRSTSQNSMYWAILSEISNETGHSSDELHDFFKNKFLPRRYIKIGKSKLRAIPTTTNLTTLEFTEYIENIKAFTATELGMEWE